MARRPSKPPPRPLGTRLPADWRVDSTWRIWAMMANIPETEYQAQAAAFERHHADAGTISDDWRGLWKTWCHDVMISRGRPIGAPVARVVVGAGAVRLSDIPHAARCSFCGSYQPGRRVELNSTDDFVQSFRFFCSAVHQANWETNQPRPNAAALPAAPPKPGAGLFD